MKYFSLLLIIAVWACNNNTSPSTETESTVTTGGTSAAGNDSLNNFIRQNPNNAMGYVARSRYYLNERNTTYALADAREALRLDTLNPQTHLMWGDVNYVIKETGKSKIAYETCINLDKQNVECRLKLAELYYAVSDFNNSLKLVEEALLYDKKSANGYFLRGMIYRDMRGDTALAMQNIQKAIDLDNEYILALDMAGVLLSAKKDPLAISYFRRILEIDPNNYPTYYNLGMYYMKIEDWNKSIEFFTKCTQMKNGDIESLFNLGYIHIQLGAHDVARDYFTQALAIQPINHRALYGRGYAYEVVGDITNAEKDYREALSYNPQHEGSKEALKRLKR